VVVPPAQAPGQPVAVPDELKLPPDVTWSETAGVSLPVSAQAGPRDTSEGRARGFERSPAGAVLAAVHLLVRVAPQVGPDVFDPTLRTQVVGPDAAAMRANVAAQYRVMVEQAGIVFGQPVGRLYAALRGYRIDAYTADAAVLQVMTEARTSDGQPVMAAVGIEVRWSGGDWALIAPPGGSWEQTVTVVGRSEAATFTAFPDTRLQPPAGR